MPDYVADAGRTDRPGPPRSRSWRRSDSTRRSCAKPAGIRSATSTCSAAGIFPLLARDFAPLAVRLSAVRRRGSRACPRSWRPLGPAGPDQRPARLASCTWRWPSSSCPASGRSPTMPWPRRRPRHGSGGRGVCGRACEKAAVTAQAGPRRASTAYLKTDLRPRVAAARAGSGATSSPASSATPSAADLTDEQILTQARVEYDAVRAEMIRIARKIWKALGAGRAAADRRQRGQPGRRRLRRPSAE